MSWFVGDDQASVNPKHVALIERALEGDVDAMAAGYLWFLVGTRLKAAFKDGEVRLTDLLSIMPDPDRVQRMAAILVDVRLWHDHDHYCDRCPRPPQGRWQYHDWRRYYKRTGAEERLERALQDERKDVSLRRAMWERDGAPKADGTTPDAARCVYCQRTVYRATRKGDLSPEMDHIWARPMGLDGIAISCRACNRLKGNRSAAEAGLTLHPTPAHAAALATRTETFSHPQGSAEMLTGTPREPASAAEGSGGAVVDEPRPEGRVGPGSPPDGVADRSWDVGALSSASGGGSSVPASGLEGAQEPRGDDDGTSAPTGSVTPPNGPHAAQEEPRGFSRGRAYGPARGRSPGRTRAGRAGQGRGR